VGRIDKKPAVVSAPPASSPAVTPQKTNAPSDTLELASGPRTPRTGWLAEAARALAPAPRAISAPVRVDGLQAAVDKRLFRDRMAGPMARYSVEEIRRTLVDDHPHLTADYVASSLAPKLSSVRPVDRYGAEPNLLLAAHIAHAMLGAPPGRTEAEVLQQVLDRDIDLEWFWPGLGPSELDNLRRAYPFIPKWSAGTKSPSDLSLGATPDSGPATADALLTEHFERSVSTLAGIPLVHKTLRDINTIRDEHDSLAGCRLVETAALVADRIPLLTEWLSTDGLRGSDISIIGKHYSADPTVVDVMRRVFGVNVVIASDDETVLSETKKAVKQACEPTADGTRTPLLCHLEGVGAWHWLADKKKSDPELPIAGVSHTTSDGRQLLGPDGAAMPFSVEMMSTSKAKRKDERMRFRQTFLSLLMKVGEALDAPIFEKRFVVLGYGGIIGPSAAKALEGMGVDFAVYDTDPKRREQAAADGIPVIDSLDGEMDRELFVLGCAGARTVTGDEIERMTKPSTFLSLGTGRREFDMARVVARATDDKGVVNRSVTGKVGHQPVCEYTMTKSSGAKITHTFLADGYVANLAFTKPTITNYGILTDALISEAVRQAKWRLDEGQSGAHALEAIQIDLSPKPKPRRVITLLPRNMHDVKMNAVPDEPALQSELDAPIFYRAAVPPANRDAAMKHIAERKRRRAGA